MCISCSHVSTGSRQGHSSDLTRVLFEIDDVVSSMRHWNKGMGSRDEEPLAAARRLVRALEEFEKLGRTAAEISVRS